MNANLQSGQLRRRLHRWTVRGLAAVVLIGSAVGGASTAATADEPDLQPAASGEQQITGGTLNWGVRYSIRNYLENFSHTAGTIAAYEGASYQKGDAYASFPVASGTVDPAAGTASIRFRGELDMRGFGDPWLNFENVRLEIAGDEAEIIVDMIESYNTRTSTPDLTLARFKIPAGALSVSDGALSFTSVPRPTDETAPAYGFTEAVSDNHLPWYGGPTYSYPNNYVDPFTVDLTVGDESGENPGDGGGEGGEGGDPETGPYGVSMGVPYSGNTAYLRVKPAYALNADGSTEVTVEGYGFDPSAPVYVGLGTMKDFGDPEKWRRSMGGSSGPIGLADYTYGAPRFVAAYETADGDVADGLMDANGAWSFTMTIPGSNVASFFGDTIDCAALQCGFFSFGAHGVVNAKNEAFAPVFFDGQDDSGWPDRDTDEPTPIPVPERPATPDTGALPSDESLTAANTGSVMVSVTGGTARVSVGADRQNTYVGAVVYSDPQFIDWTLVGSNGQFTVPLPAGLPDGDHKLAAIDANGALIGWDAFALGSGGGAAPPAKGEPKGESSATNSYGAKLTVTPAFALKDAGQTVTLTGTGFPTVNSAGTNWGGIYVLFGWVDPTEGGSWGPGKGGSSARTFTYAADGVPAGTYQRMVNYPGNTTEPSQPFMDAGGNWTMEFDIAASRFTSAQGREVDCYTMQCGIIVIGAHGRVSADAELFTPVYFTDTADQTGNAAPTNSSGGVIANANMLGNSGLGVNGGLAALVPTGSQARTSMIAGVLLVSVGLLGAALIAAHGKRSGRITGSPLRN